jgi:hypothetical protein
MKPQSYRSLNEKHTVQYLSWKSLQGLRIHTDHLEKSTELSVFYYTSTIHLLDVYLERYPELLISDLGIFWVQTFVILLGFKLVLQLPGMGESLTIPP